MSKRWHSIVTEEPKSAYLQKYKVMVVGKTGAGKSSFCNFILRRKTFVTRSGIEAVTGKAGADSVYIEGYKLYLIDTPGFGDAVSLGGGDDTVIEEMARGLQLAVEDGDPGVDMIIFVISASERFTAEDEAALAAISDSRVWSYVLLVFTKADSLDDNDKRQYIFNLLDSPTCPGGLKTLMSHVERRFMILDSRATDERYQREQRHILMDYLCSMNGKNDGKRYSHQLFVEILQKQRYHLKAETKAQLEAMKSLQEQNQAMEKMFEEEIDRLEATIKTQREEIEQMKKQGLNVEQLECDAMDMEKEKRNIEQLLMKKVEEVRELQKVIEESKTEYDRSTLEENLQEIIKSVGANKKTGNCTVL